MNKEEIIAKVKDHPTGKVKIAFCDIDGILRGKYISTAKFLSAAENGLGFCNVVLGWDSNDVAYTNTGYTGWHTGYPDAPARIDLSTYRSIPWEKDLPFFLGDFVNAQNERAAGCPRQLLI